MNKTTKLISSLLVLCCIIIGCLLVKIGTSNSQINKLNVKLQEKEVTSTSKQNTDIISEQEYTKIKANFHKATKVIDNFDRSMNLIISSKDKNIYKYTEEHKNVLEKCERYIVDNCLSPGELFVKFTNITTEEKNVYYIYYYSYTVIGSNIENNLTDADIPPLVLTEHLIKYSNEKFETIQ